MKTNITKYFNKPKIIAIIGDVNSGKSNLVYYLIKKLKDTYSFNLVTFGLKSKVPETTEIHSLEQLENQRDSLIILEEFYNLFDLDDRKKKRQIERTIRLINHANNILILVGLPNNMKKFISNTISVTFYKKSKIRDFINGSSVKSDLISYSGREMGNHVLNLKVNEVLVFDGNYALYDIDYLEEFDSKKNNKDIFVEKNVPKKIS